MKESKAREKGPTALLRRPRFFAFPELTLRNQSTSKKCLRGLSGGSLSKPGQAKRAKGEMPILRTSWNLTIESCGQRALSLFPKSRRASKVIWSIETSLRQAYLSSTFDSRTSGWALEMSMMNLSPRNQLVVVFVLATALLSTVGGLDTANYQQFFPALQQLQVSITSLQAQPDNQSLNGVVTFAIKNPTSYSGLGLQSFATNFTTVSSNGTSIPEGSIIYTPRISPLSPGATIRYTVQFVGSGSGPRQVTQFIKDGRTISYVFALILFPTTFFDRVISLSIAYLCTSSGSAAACQQQGIIIITSGTGGPTRGN